MTFYMGPIFRRESIHWKLLLLLFWKVVDRDRGIQHSCICFEQLSEGASILLSLFAFSFNSNASTLDAKMRILIITNYLYNFINFYFH